MLEERYAFEFTGLFLAVMVSLIKWKVDGSQI
jgi:hypothetical protein